METTAHESAEELRKQKMKLRKLGRVVRDLLENNPVATRRTLELHGVNDFQTFLNSGDTPDLHAIWDIKDAVYRCPQCMWELERGICSGGCRLEFDIDLRDDADYTSNEAFNPDRVSEPRGDTPLRDDDDEHYFVPSFYSNKPGGRDEYEELRRRGATRLMCETFNLEFDPDTGIIAWADGDIYDEFSGPLMQKGDFWKIMLGRRIKLDEDDPDGSEFMEALLEDALVFPLISGCKWETIEESPGIWVTRAVGITPRSAASASGSDSDESMTSSESEDSWEKRMQEADIKLEPDYIPPVLPVQAHHYEASDAESDDEVDNDMVVDEADVKVEDDGAFLEETADDADPGWAYEAHVPDTTWVPAADTIIPAGEERSNIEGERDEIAHQGLDDDSADSDFDSDEVLSGDERTLAAGQWWLQNMAAN